MAGHRAGAVPRRRWLAVVALLAGTALAADPLILVEERIPPYREAAAAVRQHLRTAVELDPGSPAAPERIRAASLIVAVGQRALQQARDAGVNVPIVFCMVLRQAPGASGPNVTGVPLETDPAALIAHVRAVYPALRRLGVLYNPRASEGLVREARQAAERAGIILNEKRLESGADVRAAMGELSGAVDALWLPPDPRLFSKEVFTYLLGASAERRMPLFAFLNSFTQAGALASISPEYSDIGDRAGRLAAEIVARGLERRPLPAPVYAPGRLSVNLKTARVLGISVPSATVAEAGQVFR